MKRNSLSINIVCFFIIFFASCIFKPDIQAPYFGREPPGETPEIFCPDVISYPGNKFRESDINFWPGGLHCIFSRFGEGIEDYTIFESECSNGFWSNPIISDIFPDGAYLPCVTPDGNEIIFTPVESAGTPTPQLYSIKWEQGSWTEPVYICGGMYPSVTKTGNLYYTDGRFIVCRKKYKEGFQEKTIVGKDVLMNFNDGHPFIDPDETYLIYDTNDELFITYSDTEKNWSPPQKMNIHGIKARVSYDRKFIFYHFAGDIWWVDAGIIEKLRPRHVRYGGNLSIKNIRLFESELFSALEEIHSTPTILNSGNKMYLSIMGDSGIRTTEFTGTEWKEPELVSEFYNCRDISISPDGQRIYFFKDSQDNSENIWYAERDNLYSEWENFTQINDNINKFDVHWGAAVDNDYTLYFGAAINEDAAYDIYFSSFQDGEYQKAKKMSESVNTPDCYEDTPFITPEGNYLLFTRSSPDWMQKNLYISYFNKQNQTWSEAEKLPYPVNTGSHELSPKIIFGNKLLFLSERSGKLLPYVADVVIDFE